MTNQHDEASPDGVPRGLDSAETGIKKMIARARRRGFISYDELDAALSPHAVSCEQIEAILSSLSDMGVSVIEEAAVGDHLDDLCFEEEVEPTQGEPALGLDDELVDHEHWPSEPNIWWKDEDAPHPNLASADLTLSMSGLAGLGPCIDAKDIAAQFASAFPEWKEEFTVSDARRAGQSLDHVLWPIGMLSSRRNLVGRRLTGFVADSLIELVARLERERPWDDGLRRAIVAARAFVADKIDIRTLLSETKIGQQSWLSITAPAIVATTFPWVRQRGGFVHATSKFPYWTEWAEWVAWSLQTVRSLFPNDWTNPELSALHEGLEERLYDRLVQWFEDAPPEWLELPAFSAAATPPARASIDEPLTVSDLRLEWHDFAVLPTGCRHIDNIDMGRNAELQLPFSLRSIGTLNLYRCRSGGLGIQDGVVEIGAIDLEESELALPTSVETVGDIHLQYEASLSHPGVKKIGNLTLQSCDFDIDDGVVEVGNIATDNGNLSVPSSVLKVGNIALRNGLEDDESKPEITWQHGTVEVGDIVLGEHLNLTIPASVRRVRSLTLSSGAKLHLSSTTDILEGCELAEGSELIRR